MSGKKYSREFKEDAVRQVTGRGTRLALRVCLSAQGVMISQQKPSRAR